MPRSIPEDKAPEVKVGYHVSIGRYVDGTLMTRKNNIFSGTVLRVSPSSQSITLQCEDGYVRTVWAHEVREVLEKNASTTTS